MTIPEEHAVSKPGFWTLFSTREKDLPRLRREHKLFCVELDCLTKRTVETPEPWLPCAQDHLEHVSRCIGDSRQDIEGGWVALNAARRASMYGLTHAERIMQARVLELETEKISSWRSRAIKDLLKVDDDKLTADALVAAMALRDEYFSNQYHKVWMVAGQLWLLLRVCALGVLALVPLVYFYSRHPGGTLSPWGWQMVLAVVYSGLFGAAFSTAGSLMNPEVNARIPERVANQFVTSARTLFGAGAGLAGYAFYQAKVLNIKIGAEDGPGAAITVAFLFGFTGEKLISNVLGALSGRSGS